MKIDAALTPVRTLGFDTAPIIYYIEANPTYIDRMDDIMARMDVGQFKGAAEALTIAEVLVVPRRSGNAQLEAEYRRLLLHGRNFGIVNIDSVVAGIAADLRGRHGIKLPDALQIACALHSRCDLFLTNDRGLKRVSEIHVLTVDELEL